MKKTVRFIFTFLPLYICADIHGQENDKKTKTPWSGTVSLNYDFTNNFTGNINLGYNQKTWDLYLDYAGHSDRIEISSELFRSFNLSSATTLQKIETEQHHYSHLTGIQLNLHPSSRNLFQWNFRLQFPKITTNQDLDNRETFNGETSANEAHNRIAFSRKTIETSLYYKHIYEKDKHELSMNGIFSHTQNSRPATYNINELLSHTADGNETPEFTRLQLNYLRTLANEGQLETGIRFFSRWNKMQYHFYNKDEHSDVWINDINRSNSLHHTEYIYSAYLSYSQQWGERLSYKIGLYSDYNITRTKLPIPNEQYHVDRFYPYPRLTVIYTPTEHQEVAFHFTRENVRPTYYQLNPFTNTIDYMTFEKGNPSLRPEIINRAEINYSVTGKYIELNSSLYFNSTEKFITPVAILPVAHALTLTYTNGCMQNKIGADFNFPAQITSWMSVTPSVSIAHTHSTGQFQDIDLYADGFHWTGDIELTLTSKKNTEFQANFSYHSPMNIPQFKIEENYYLDLSIKQGFLKNKLEVSFSVSDVFDTSAWTARSSRSTPRLDHYSKEATHAYWLGLTFNFNSFKHRPGSENTHPEKHPVIRLGQ